MGDVDDSDLPRDRRRAPGAEPRGLVGRPDLGGQRRGVVNAARAAYEEVVRSQRVVW